MLPSLDWSSPLPWSARAKGPRAMEIIDKGGNVIARLNTYGVSYEVMTANARRIIAAVNGTPPVADIL